MSVIALVAGLAVVAFGFARWLRAARWTAADGVVVGFEASLHESNRGVEGSVWTRVYAPVFEWVDDAGTTHRRTSDIRSTRRPKRGKRVQVRFDPADPRRAQIFSFGQSGGLIMLVGLVFVAFGIYGLLAPAASGTLR